MYRPFRTRIFGIWSFLEEKKSFSIVLNMKIYERVVHWYQCSSLIDYLNRTIGTLLKKIMDCNGEVFFMQMVRLWWSYLESLGSYTHIKIIKTYAKHHMVKCLQNKCGCISYWNCTYFEHKGSVRIIITIKKCSILYISRKCCILIEINTAVLFEL